MATQARVVSIRLTGNNKELLAALKEAGYVVDDTADRIGTKMDTASTRVGGVFQKLGNQLSNWGLPFGESVSKIGEKFESADTKGKKFTQSMSTLGGATLLGVGAGLVGVGVEAVEMADKFDTAQSQLQTAIKNAGGDFEKLKPKISATYDAMAKFGFNSTDTATALAQLTTATGSPTKAMGDMQLAANLARLKNISLSDASGILTKTLAGSTRGLTALGLNLDIGSAKLSSMHSASVALQTAQGNLKIVQGELADGTLKGAAGQVALEKAQRAVDVASQNLSRDQKAEGDIMDALKKKTDGAAAAYGNTLPGQMAAARASLHNVGTEFGEFLTPKIQEAAHALASTIGWFQKNKWAAEVLGGVIATVLGAAVTIFAVEKSKKLLSSLSDISSGVGKAGQAVWGFAQKTLSSSATAEGAFTTMGAEAEAAEATTATAMEGMEEATVTASEGTDAAIGSTGIGAILIGVGLAVTLLATHWKEVWHAIRDVAEWAYHELDQFIHSGIGMVLLAPIAPLILLATHFSQVFNGIKTVAVDTWQFLDSNFIQPFTSFVTGTWQTLTGAISTAWSNCWNGLESIVSGVWGGIKGAINTGIDGINTLIQGFDDVTGFLHLGPHIPKIPHLATGTSNFQGGMALVGEKGPELVVLPGGSQVIPNNQLTSRTGPLAPQVTSTTQNAGNTFIVQAETNADPVQIMTELYYLSRRVA